MQREAQTPQDMLSTLVIRHTHTLLGDVTRWRTAERAQRTHNLPGQSPVLAGDEEGPARVDFTQKLAGANMAIGNPPITRLHGA
jgi:hypothetical protein